MSLRCYCGRRLLILPGSTTALDAARAMEANGVGLVVVQRDDRLLGVVTDRDLAILVVASGADAAATAVADLVRAEPVTVSVDADEAEAIRRMCECGVRRVPVVEEGRVVGIVSVDDLIVAGAIELDQLAEIVRVQLEGQRAPHPITPPAPAEPSAARRAEAERRHEARAAETLDRLVRRVQELASLPERGAAEAALDIVVGAICRRVPPEEAADFMAQLPSKVRERALSPVLAVDRHVGRGAMEDEIARRIGVSAAQASAIATAIGAALAEVLSVGHVRHVQSQLPADMRELLSSGC